MFDQIKLTLETEWPLITGIALLVIACVIVVAVVAWTLRGIVDQGRDARVEARLRRAADKFALATEEKAQLDAHIARLRRQISAKEPLTVLDGTLASMETHAVKLGSLWESTRTAIAASSRK
jgi:hypothetical protein